MKKMYRLAPRSFSISFYFIFFVCVFFFIEFLSLLFPWFGCVVWMCEYFMCILVCMLCGYFRFGIQWQWFMVKQSSQISVYFCVSFLVVLSTQNCGRAHMVYGDFKGHNINKHFEEYENIQKITPIYTVKTQVNVKQQTQSNSKHRTFISCPQKSTIESSWSCNTLWWIKH